jgi:hypothetical protein
MHTQHVAEKRLPQEEEMSESAPTRLLVAMAVGLGLAFLALQPVAAANFTIGFAVVETVSGDQK